MQLPQEEFRSSVTKKTNAPFDTPILLDEIERPRKEGACASIMSKFC
jgi:hypothetical protein